MANNIVLRPQRRTFDIDDDNKDVLRFLLYYFNGCPLAEEVFPGRGYKLHKNILLQGPAGVGKTMMLQIFAEYLRRNGNPRQFLSISVTEMVNYYTVFNNIDRYLYNVKDSKSFQGNPINLCLNDIGVENRPFYGVDTNTIVSDFLHARNEIWTNFSDFDRKFAHLTTNLTIEQLKKKFSLKDEYGRIIDRFKTYNVIPVTGKSRR
ncbi:MAG: AAA family ATPase [Muribaculaceae bacterium]|nr:AAA family ATPase [Muribaculaceae bacterium]